MTEAASTIPFGIATTASNGPTGWGSTRVKVPGITTFRPVAGSSRRWYFPAGNTQVRAAARRTQPTSRVSGWGKREGRFKDSGTAG